jgi:gamma-glutamylcyclotransferase (GGCT)/AIG2-like uncharacterized protein YtfP
MSFYMGCTHLSTEEAANLSVTLDKILERNEGMMYTRDNPEIMLQKEHFLFTYGTLKSGFRRHRAINSCPLIGVGYTISPFWKMFNVNKLGMDKQNKLVLKDRYPVTLINGSEKKDSGKIYGELYKVTNQDIRNLDYIESNKVIYRRVLINVKVKCLHDQQERTLKAWMYIGEPTWWSKHSNLLEEIPLLQSNQDKNFKYYSYMKKYDIEVQ